MERNVEISPSLICADLCNLESEVKKMEECGLTNLHIDFIDGQFSPSMPLGFAAIEKLRTLTNLRFDIHIMTVNNELFIQESVKAGADTIYFHYESAFHVQRMIQLIRDSGCKVGIALNPATPINVLDCVVGECDYVLLMLISPGYAGNKNEGMIPYALDKVKELRNYLDQKNPKVRIAVDGRVSPEVIPDIIKAGADILVSGSTGVFKKGQSMEENCTELNKAVMQGLKG